MYSLIDKATEAVYGKNYKNITDQHKQVAVEKLFSMLNKEDEWLENLIDNFFDEMFDEILEYFGYFVDNEEKKQILKRK